MTKYKYGNPEAPIVLIQPVGDHDLPEIEGEVAQIRKLTALDFQMIAVKVDDWNLDLSPWKAPAVFGNEDFGDCSHYCSRVYTTAQQVTHVKCPIRTIGQNKNVRLEQKNVRLEQ